MSDFKKICVTFSILNLQKCDGYQNGAEFRHKPNELSLAFKGHISLDFMEEDVTQILEFICTS